MAGESMAQRDLQKVNVKFFLEAREGLDSDSLLAVFGRWRLEAGEEIVDLADYGHVPEGPGVILISHRWHFGIDWGGGRPGLFYASRRDLTGGPEARFKAVIRACLEQGKRLLAEPELRRGAVKPLLGELEVVLNDRLLAPNTDESEAAWRPGLEAVLDWLYTKGGYALERDPDPGRRLGWRAQAGAAAGLTIDGALARLA